MFEAAPFDNCPKCGKPECFGVLMICDRHYVKRCKKCRFSKHFGLPEVSKRFILLDQFIFSNIAKVLDRDFDKSRMTKPDCDFYKGLFSKLERLFRYHQIVCPHTQIHRDESLVSEDYEKFKIIWSHLSSDIALIDPEIVYYRQVWGSFERWMGGKGLKDYRNDPAEICDDRFNTWMDHLRISFDLPRNQAVADELQFNKEKRKEWLEGVFKDWKADKNLTFKDWFNQEINGSIRLLEKQFHRQVKIYFDLKNNPNSHNAFDLFGNTEADLFMKILNALRESELTEKDVFEKMGDFFGSEHYRNLPMVKIECALWAGLAHHICHGGMSPPRESIYNDFRSIAAYLPFLESIIVDRECYNILTQNPVRDFISIPTKVFSLGQREGIVAHLDRLEAKIPDLFKDQIRTLYGDDWLEPYYEIIDNQFHKTNS